MTQQQYKKALDSELKRLNEHIDLKIVFGESYDDESRRHRMLLEQARKLKRRDSFNRVFRFFSFT